MGNLLLPYQVVSNMADISKVVNIFGNFFQFSYIFVLEI